MSLPPSSRRQRRISPPPPPVAERLRGALLGLWLGDLMGCATQGQCFRPPPEFPGLYAKPEAPPPGRPHPRGHSPGLGFAACAAYCLLKERTFELHSLLQAYLRYFAFLQLRGTLAPLSLQGEEEPPPPAPEEGGAPAPLEPALAFTLKSFPRFRSAQAFLGQHLRSLPALPVLDGVLLRSLPVACFFYAQEAARVEAVAQVALATGTGALGALSCIALGGLLSACILSEHSFAPDAALLEAMQQHMQQAAPRLVGMGLHPEAVHKALCLLEEDVEYAQKACPNLYGPGLSLRQHAGQLRPSFRLALWELLHAPGPLAPPPSACVIEDVVRRGGSPPSQGALVAALYGARWGKRALPNPGLEPLAPVPSPPPLSCGEASFLTSLAETLAARLGP